MNTYNLSIYRALALISTFDIDENTIYTKTLMGDHSITSQVSLQTALALQLGDYITYKGKTFVINTLPELYADDVNLRYTIIFEPYVYTMYDKLLMHLGDSDFPYFGTLQAFADLVINNITEISADWLTGDVDVTEPLYITFSGDTCRTAITKIADAFKVEYDVDEKTLTFKKNIGNDTAIVLKVGKQLGLYNLTRRQVNDKNVVTRVFGFGSSKNIDYTYRDGAKRLVFNARKLENNISLYGIKEGVYTNEEIYPHRTGTLTAKTDLIGGTFTITDTSLDFNINTYLQEGTAGRVAFTIGELTGYEFEIQSYDNATKTIKLKPFTDANDYILPNATYKAQVGDKYVLLSINFPQEYIDVAEAELLADTQAYIDQNSVPQVVYELALDEKHFRDNNISLFAGDFVGVEDTRLGVNGQLRISAISYPLVNEANVNATISNFILSSEQNRLTASIVNTRTTVKENYRSNILEARRQTANLANLKDDVFDPAGDYYTDKIKPGSVETLYLSTGAKQNDFNLADVLIKANLNGDASQISISNGRLLHNSIEIAGLGFSWVMSGITQTGLVDATRYYIYAKCSKVSLVGTFVVSDTQIKLEDVADYYHFNMGVLFAKNADGYRDFEFTKGMAYLVGDTLTAGKIKSIDAQTYWDLTNGQFKLGNSTKGLDWNVTTADTLTIKGALVQSASGATAPIPMFRGAFNGANTYYKGEIVTYAGSSWTYINATAGSSTPAENSYWTASAKKGADGTSITIKGNVANYASLPSTGNTVGDGYITDDNGHLWMWNGTTWADLGEIRGPAGANGDTAYLHIKYSNDGGATFTASSGEAVGSFIGQYTDFNATDSSNVADYTWAQIKGNDGVAGPSIVGRGVYDDAKVYVGTTTRVDVVKYGSTWYKTKVTAGTITAGTLPTNTTYFETFGATFESVATDLFFATLAYIENLGVRNLATDTAGNKRVVINGVDNSIRFYTEDSGSTPVVSIDDNLVTIDGVNFDPGVLVGYYGSDYTGITAKGIAMTGDIRAVDGEIIGKSIGAIGNFEVGGTIKVGDKTGITATLNYSLGGSIYYMKFANGIMYETGLV